MELIFDEKLHKKMISLSCKITSGKPLDRELQIGIKTILVKFLKSKNILYKKIYIDIFQSKFARIKIELHMSFEDAEKYFPELATFLNSELTMISITLLPVSSAHQNLILWA